MSHISNTRKRPIKDKKDFASSIINQWKKQEIKSQQHKVALEYITAVSYLGSYSNVYDAPEPPVAIILAQYGLLEQ